MEESRIKEMFTGRQKMPIDTAFKVLKIIDGRNARHQEGDSEVRRASKDIVRIEVNLASS